MSVKVTDSSRVMITDTGADGIPAVREIYTTTDTNINNRKVGTEDISGTKLRGGTVITGTCGQTSKIMDRIDNGTQSSQGLLVAAIYFGVGFYIQKYKSKKRSLSKILF